MRGLPNFNATTRKGFSKAKRKTVRNLKDETWYRLFLVNPLDITDKENEIKKAER